MPKKRWSTAPKYPWDMWLARGATNVLVAGKDYTCTTRTMVNYIYAKARKAKVKVSIRGSSDSRIQVSVLNGKM